MGLLTPYKGLLVALGLLIIKYGTFLSLSIDDGERESDAAPRHFSDDTGIVAAVSCWTYCILHPNCKCAMENRMKRVARHLFVAEKPLVAKAPEFWFASKLEMVDSLEDVKSARAALKPLAPLVLRIHACNGLTNQRIGLLDGITMGVILGAQILLPDSIPFNGVQFRSKRNVNRNLQGLGDMFNLTMLENEVSELYHDYWCDRPEEAPAGIWCNGDGKSPLIYGSESLARSFDVMSERDDDVHVNYLHRVEAFTSESIGVLRAEVYDNLGHGNSYKISEVPDRILVDVGCTHFALHVDELDDTWPVFWRLNDALAYVKPIEDMATSVQEVLASASRRAQANALRLGYPSPAAERQSSKAYNVLHLRAERDWQEHCNKWVNPNGRLLRDNCMNNTMVIHNVLLSEGVDPGVPLYVSTALSKEEMLSLEITGPLGDPRVGLKDLFEIYTVITKEDALDISPRAANEDREYFAALDHLLAEGSEMFVGNSVSSFSAFVLIDRWRRRAKGIHYTGGSLPMAERGHLRPEVSLSIPTLREPIKWVFTLHYSLSTPPAKEALDAVRVAVLSALEHTDLIPVCVTTSPKNTKIATWLAHNGVRVIYHEPLWREQLSSKLAVDEEDDILNRFLRIDIPTLGFLDEFVLYTDTDVMFTGEVTWQTILGGETKFQMVHSAADFSTGSFYHDEPGEEGLPMFFSASEQSFMRSNHRGLNEGVMLMNMRNLRETHGAFLQFLLNSDHLLRSAGKGNVDAYNEFYKTSRFNLFGGSADATILPYELNWKHYWRNNTDARIIHFHGPQCQDIARARVTGEVPEMRGKDESFGAALSSCETGGNCNELCEQYRAYLEYNHI